jgi:hypothetical protein
MIKHLHNVKEKFNTPALQIPIAAQKFYICKKQIASGESFVYVGVLQHFNKKQPIIKFIKYKLFI